MYNNRRKGISYFAEERTRNNNPRFYERVEDRELRRQVKRIAKDIKNEMIEDQDLIYFKNPKIISACINVAREEWLNATVTSEALLMYLNSPAYSSFNIYNYDTTQKRITASNELNRLTVKANIWKMYLDMFTTIESGAVNIKEILQFITLQKFNPNYDL